MSATVKYKGATIATVNNQTKTLETSGTWLEDDIEITDVTATSKNVQAYIGRAETNATSLTATAVKVTVSKAGTYKCSWTGWRSNGSGTFSSRLYKNGSAVGSDHTSFTRTYGQNNEETLTLAAGDELVVRARSRGSSYYMVVANLIIEEQ